MQSNRKSAVRFRERSELLDFLLEVTTATGNTLDLDELLANVAQIVKKVIPYELFALLLYSEKRRDLRIRYAVGPREEVVRNLSIALCCVSSPRASPRPSTTLASTGGWIGRTARSAR